MIKSISSAFPKITHAGLSHLALLVSTIIFGANYYISKDLLSQNIKPEQLLFIRTFGAVLLFWIVGIFVKAEKPDKKAFIKLVPAAFFGLALNQLLFFKGLQQTSSVNAAIIHVVNPIVVMVLSMIFLKFPITRLKAAGVFIGAIGATFLILFDKKLSFAMDSMQGNTLILTGTIAYAAYLIISKPLLKTYHPIVIMKWIYLLGFLFILPFTLGDVYVLNLKIFTFSTYTSLLFVIVFVTFLAYLLTIYALKHLMPTLVSYYIYLQPIIAVFISWYAGAEILVFTQFIAALLIVAGVILVNKSGVKAKLNTSDPKQ